MIEATDTTSRAAATDGTPPDASAHAGVAQLIEARKARGYGVSDVAAKLGMSVRQVDAIERADWAALPGQAFVRGAIRSYGKAVGVDVQPILATLGVQPSSAVLRPSSSLDAALTRGGGLSFSSDGSAARMFWILLGVAVVFGMVLYFGEAFDMRESEPAVSSLTAADAADAAGTGSATSGASALTPPSTQQVSPPAGQTADGTVSSQLQASGGMAGATPSISPQAAAAGTAQPGQGSQTIAGGSAPPGAAQPGQAAQIGSAGQAGSPAAGSVGSQPGPSQSATAGTGALTPLAPLTPMPPAPAQAAASDSASESSPAAPGSLSFRFEQESWVDIRGPQGKPLLYGLQPAGTTREIPGPGPFNLVVGNASHVVLEHGGQRVDLASRARSGVARLKLD